MHSRLLTVAIAGLVSGLASTGLSAQSLSGTQVIQEIEVTSNSRRSEGLADINAAVSVLGEGELNLIRHFHFQQALNRLPGVNVHRNNGQESLLSIRSPVLTGAGACGNFLVTENGVPVRASGFCNVNEMFDAHTENAGSIEVVRGPSSAFWGSNALHGLINVVLPEPGEAGTITLEGGGVNGSYRANGAFGTDHGAFKQIVLFNGANEEGYRDDSGVDQQKLSWLYSYDNGGAYSLEGGISVNNLNQETAGFVVGERAYEGDLRDTNPNPEAYRDSSNTRVWTRINFAVGDWDMAVTPYWREVNMNFIQHFLPGQPVEDFEHRSLGFQFNAYNELEAGGVLSFGIDAENTEGSLLQFQALPTQGSAFLRNTIPQGRHYDYDVDGQQLALFAAYERDFGNGWSFSIGARAERMEYDYDNKMIDGRTDEFGVPCGFGGCRYSRPADRSDDFNTISPKLGLAYALNDEHSLQFRAQQGFRAPQATELYRLQGSQTVADLDVVELDAYEIALVGAGANWDYAVTLYTMDKENEIFRNSARINVNTSETEHNGVEFAAGLDITDTLSLRGAYNFAEHSYQSSLISGGIDVNGNDIDTAPRRFGNVRLNWRPIPKLNAELEWVNMGRYFTNPENTADYEGHDLANLRVQYLMNDDINLSLNILNLTDEEYAERADWTTFTGDRYFPGQPLRAFLGVTYNFR